MYKSVLSGLLVCGSVFLLSPAHASAANESIPFSDGTKVAAVKLADVIDDVQKQKVEVSVDTDEKEEDKETKHVVAEDETLSKIAKQHETTWKRIFDKNVEIESPDVINPGDELVIPKGDEELEARELPTPPAPEPAAPQPVAQPSRQTTRRATSQPAATPRRSVAQAAPAASAPAPRGSSAGNLYAYGYCTWYVKNMRPDMPNNLGNANTWATRARAQGMATGSAPRAGAVAVATTGYMHVAYVTGVNGDGTVNLSEMNFRGWNVVSSRTAPAHQFVYIY